MTKYIGYLMLLVAFYGGYAFWHPGLILVFALIATLMFATARRKSVRVQERGGPGNAILDGLFLFVLQLMIMFFVYNLGLFVSKSLNG